MGDIDAVQLLEGEKVDDQEVLMIEGRDLLTSTTATAFRVHKGTPPVVPHPLSRAPVVQLSAMTKTNIPTRDHRIVFSPVWARRSAA